MKLESLQETLGAATASGHIGCVVAMVANSKDILWEGAFGHADTHVAAMPDSLFWIASMTKAVTAVAVLQLVERGLLALDEPVGQWVPQLEHPDVLHGFGADGAPMLRPATCAVTLRHLLTHTSGLCYDLWNGDMKKYLATTGLPAIGSGALAALGGPLVSEPGTRWEYGTGIDNAGRAVEAASGLDLQEYFRRNIFGPLGMTDTTFQLSAGQKARVVAMRKRLADGSLQQTAFETNQSPGFFSGGGGLFGTAPDYIRFCQMILRGGQGSSSTILRPDSIALLRDNQIGHLDVNLMRSQSRGGSNDVDIWPGMVKKWSLGYLLNTQPTPEGRSAGSLAWAGLSNCYYWIDIARDITGVMLMQTLPFYDAPSVDAFRTFERAVYAEA